jgi:hypothetical protein
MELGKTTPQHWLGFALLVCTLIAPTAARADFLKIVGWKGERKSRVKALVWRQHLDLKKGFDGFFIEEYEAPANKRVKSAPITPRARKKWLPLGQLEVYLQEVATAGKRLLETYHKKGYEEACNIASFPFGQGKQATFSIEDTDLTLRLAHGSRRDEVLLQKGKKQSYSLVRIQPPGGRNAPTVGGRTIVQATLLRGGRMLAVVVRTQFLPAPQHVPEDSLYFFPLRRATKRLSLPYPFPVENCVQKDDPWP